MKRREKIKFLKGFTLIELLVIVAIILILAGVILTSLYRARVRSNAVSTMYSMKSVASAAYGCLAGTLPGVQLALPGGSGICAYNSGGALVIDPSYPGWPDVSKKSWDMTPKNGPLGPDGFYWCQIGSATTGHPTSVGSYQNEIYGGGNSSGEFCFMLKKDNMYIWCVPTGCRGEGF